MPRARIVDIGNVFGAPSGEAISARRTSAGWSQSELGALVGVKQGAINAWELETRPVPPGRIVLLLAALADADEAAIKLHEEAVRRVVDDVSCEPGVSEAQLLHDHRQRGGRVLRTGHYATALADAKRRRLVVEGTVTENVRGYPKTRTGLFTPDQAPDRIAPMTGDELGQRRNELELTQAELARLGGVSSLTVLHWEQQRQERIPEHAAKRVRAAFEKTARGPRPSEMRRKRLTKLIKAQPGVAKHRLWGKGAGDTEQVERDLSALIENGAIELRDAWDSCGRKYRGYYLASASQVAFVELSGTQLRQHRECAGWTQAALALALGVQPHTISRWESGTRSCPPHRAAEVVRVLDGQPPESP